MDFKTLKFLLGINRRGAPVLWPLFVASAWLAWLVSSAQPALTAWFVSSLVTSISAGSPPSWIPLACLVGAIAVEAVLWRVGDVLSTFSYAKCMSLAYRESFDAVLSRPAKFFEDELSGTLASRINQAASSLRWLDAHFSYGIPSAVMALVVTGLTLAYISPWLILVYVVWLILLATAIVLLNRWIDPFRDRRYATDSRLTGAISDILGGAVAVLALGVRAGQRRDVREKASDAATARKASGLRYDVTIAVLAFLNQAVIVSCFIFLFWKASRGEASVAESVLLVGTIGVFSNVSFGIRNVVLDMGETLSEARGLRELLENSTAPEPSVLPEISVPRGAIEFRDLSFGYVPERKVFDGLDLAVKPGERVALVGPSGAGKSTLIKLALRLYAPDAGSVLVDGNDVSKFDPDSLRRQVALVPQEPALFHRSIFENVALAREGATREMVEKALRAAHAWEIVERLPQGMDSVVGERGVKLSGGERQRVALARAFIRDAKIVLLDEPTSALDSVSERAIQTAMGELLKGRTSLTVAHRLSTVMRADRIVVLEHGKIAEQGTHAQLLEKGGLYAKLWNLQAGGMLGDVTEA